MDAARQPGHRRQPRARLRRRSRDDGEYLIVAAGLRRGVPGRERASTRRRRAGSRSRATGCGRCEGIALHATLPASDAPTRSATSACWFARHATLEAGTGLVHTAPGHGADDYVVGREHGLPIFAPVDEHGRFTGRGRPAAVGRHAGVRRQPRDRRRPGRRAACCSNKPGETVRHQYPHCWRCKNPIIFRATEQWFARLGDADDETSLRAARARRDRAHPVDPGVGREPHPRHDRGAPRLVPVAPARLGRADPGVSLHGVREGSARRARLSSTSPTSSRARARTPGSRARRPSCCRPAPRVRRAAAGSSTSRTTSSTSGSSRACRGRRWRRASWCRRARRSTSTSRARTSTAAGSTRRC